MRGLSWCCLPSLQCGEGAGESCSHPCPYYLQLLREQTPAPSGTLGKAGPAPFLGSTVEATLWMKAEVSQPENVSMGDLAPPLTCRMVAWVGERSPPLINFSRGEGVRPEVIECKSCLCSPSAVALRRAGAVPCLDNTIELTLFTEMWTHQPWSCELETVVPTPCLLCSGGGEIPLFPHTLLPATDKWADPPPYQMQPSGKYRHQILTWATQ